MNTSSFNRSRHAKVIPAAAVVALAMTMLLIASRQARAATFTVNTNADAVANATHCSGINTCTLRDAIALANTAGGTNTISFSSTVTAPIVLSQGVLLISNSPAQNLTINGNGSATTIVDGNATSEVMNNAATTSMSGVTIRNGSTSLAGGGILNGGSLTLTNSVVSGNTTSSGSGGGGIYATGPLALISSTISGNHATGVGSGGGILTTASMTVTNSTVSGNTATGVGGGIRSDSILTLTNSTISGNAAAVGGGVLNFGVVGSAFTVSSTNSTIAGNTAPNGSGLYLQSVLVPSTANLVNTILANAPATNCSLAGGTITSSGNNLDTGTTCGFTAAGDKQGSAANPVNLGPLQNNGGPTQTQALLAGSPAIDTGSNTTCASGAVGSLDQRGLPRFPTGDPTCDMGAFEVQPAVVTTPPPGLPQAGSIPNTGTRSLDLLGVTILLLGVIGTVSVLRSH